MSQGNMELPMYKPTKEGEGPLLSVSSHHISNSVGSSTCIYVTYWVPFHNCFLHNFFLVERKGISVLWLQCCEILLLRNKKS